MSFILISVKWFMFFFHFVRLWQFEMLALQIVLFWPPQFDCKMTSYQFMQILMKNLFIRNTQASNFMLHYLLMQDKAGLPLSPYTGSSCTLESWKNSWISFWKFKVWKYTWILRKTLEFFNKILEKSAVSWTWHYFGGILHTNCLKYIFSTRIYSNKTTKGDVDFHCESPWK